MTWFVLAYFGPMLLLALWLAVGIFFALRERVSLGTGRRSTYNHPRHTDRGRFAERNGGFEFTSSSVREAFEMFLNAFESGTTNQSR